MAAEPGSGLGRELRAQTRPIMRVQEPLSGSARRALAAFDRLPVTQAALAFASQAHAGQRRESDFQAFILHPIEVAALLAGTDARDEVIAAGILHDTLEKTSVTARELTNLFGARVTALVQAVSEDPTIANISARKTSLRRQVELAGRDAALVFAADKISKVRELRVLDRTGRPVPWKKRRYYRECLRTLSRVIPGHPLVDQLGFELTLAGV